MREYSHGETSKQLATGLPFFGLPALRFRAFARAADALMSADPAKLAGAPSTRLWG